MRNSAGRVGHVLVIALSLSASATYSADAEGPPVLQLGETRLFGQAGGRHPGVASFRGIPFAEPPVGDLRWRAPQPLSPPSGRRDATRFAAACFQDSYNTQWYRKVGAAFGADAATFRDPPSSEDCLYLNVWTPAAGKDARLPVMVWIHGGANRAGWSFEPNYDGEALAARGVVVVSLAYRIGIFGFFGHAELDGAANFGLLDQIEALRWVQRHVAAFGGDARNVTLFGESAGAADIGYLMLSPAARGLFRRAISQSGGYQLLEQRSRIDAEALGRALGAALAMRPTLADLRSADAPRILAEAKAALGTVDFGPAVDGAVVAAPPGPAVLSQPVPVELLVGSNEDEWYMYVDDDSSKLAAAIDSLPEAARPALRRLAQKEPDVRHGHDRALTFANMVCPAYLMARAARRAGTRAFVYRFMRVRPGPGGARLGAYHGAEIPYVFDTHDDWMPGDAADRRLTERVMRYWTNFARNGDPNGDDLPVWPAYDVAAPQVMALGDNPGPRPAPEHALCLEQANALYGARP